MSPISKKIVLITILLCVYSLAVFTRIGVCRHFMKVHSPFLPFTGESALLYRYAEMAAENKRIPELDVSAQYPEGLFPKQDLSLGFEFAAGSIYRLFFKERMEFHSFIRYFTPFFFCTGVFALFLITMQLTRGTPHTLHTKVVGAITGALFYAVSLPAVIRATGQEISRENYCLPLIFFHIYFLIKYMRDRKISSSVPAGLLLFVSLVLWEGAQVYFYILVLFMTLSFVFEREDFRWLPGFTVITGFALLAGMSIPYLRNHFFMASFPALVSYALVACGYLVKKIPCLKHRNRKTLLLISLILILILTVHSFSEYAETYSHMRSLLWYKLRFLNQKPYNPSLLPLDVRILWTPALTSPSASSIVFHFSTLLILSIFSVFPVIIRSFKQKIQPDEEFLLVNLLMFFLLYIMFRRMEVFLVFFMCVFIGKWVSTLTQYPKRKAAAVYCLIFLCILFEGSKVAANVDSIGRPVDYNAAKNLISWIKEETPQESVILSHFNLSPPILLYTGRKIVLHPKFELPAVREKVNEYLFALFDHSEEKFYSFCQKVSADFFIFPRGTFSTTSRYSWRYMTATPRSDRDCNAYLFEFRPRKLKKFGLEYDNGRYMVYRIYQPDVLRNAESHLKKGTVYLERQLYRKAIDEYIESIRVYPQDARAYKRMGTAYYLCGDEEKAREFWNLAHNMEGSK